MIPLPSNNGRVFEWIQVQGKTKLKWVYDVVYYPEFTVLDECMLCHRLSTRKRICERNDVYGWNREGRKDFSPSKSKLCTTCWNKVKVIVHAEKEIKDSQKLLNKLDKELANGRKKTGNIKTTGELRDFLATMLNEVKTGKLPIDKASQITKMVGQINESFHAEVRVAKTMLEAGEESVKLGELCIGSKNK